MAQAPFKMASLAKGKESLDSKPGKITSPPYSFEHRIVLDANTLDKLGIDVPNVGDKMHVMGHGEVTNVSQHDSQDGGKTTRVELQLKKLGLRKKGGGLASAIDQGIKEANDD